MPDILMYDIATDERRVVTQEDVDRLVTLVGKLMSRPEPQIPEDEISRVPNFRLAIYPNRMRADGVFVAEEKPIEPYEFRGINGEPLYPSVPNTPYSLRSQLSHAFAYELVRRWNLVADNA